ncbi:MAG TPA: MauE/DoxX family redox-associated membrane protein [Solirubrobacteraceae bacterium]|nr:MauE/DoxX family redox-associated membrane protein [Solirubrobacteraceae bacterium]
MVAQVATLPIAVVLTASAAGKLVAPAPARGFVRQVLGAPGGAAAVVAGLAVSEALLAVALTVAPGTPTLLAAGTLFAAFAALGLHQLATRSRIECGCLGALSSTRVGWPQVLQLPLVLALLVAASALPRAGTTEGVAWLVAAELGACALLLAGAARPWRAVRAQRLSLSAPTDAAG